MRGIVWGRVARLALTGIALVSLAAWVYEALRLAAGMAVGADFMAYYVGAKMVLAGQGASLYDLGRQLRTEAQVLGLPVAIVNQPLYFINPPYVALMALPLAGLPYRAAYFVWMALNAVLLVVACAVGVKAAGISKQWRWTVGLLALASTACFLTVLRGQLDGMVMLGGALGLLAWGKGKMGWAGLALGLLAVKPQLAVVPAAYLLVRWQWRALAGMAVVGAVGVVATVASLGAGVWADYARFLIPGGSFAGIPHAQTAAHIYSVWGLVAWAGGPDWVGWALAGVVLVAFAVVAAGRRGAGLGGLGAALALAVPLAAHRGAQDLVLETLALLVAVGMAGRGGGRWAAALAGGGYIVMQLCLLWDQPVALGALGLGAGLLWLNARAEKVRTPATDAPALAGAGS